LTEDVDPEERMKNLPVIDRIHWKALEDKKNWPAVAFRRRPLMILDAITGEFAPPNNTLDSLLERYGDDEFRVSQRVFSLPTATDLCQLRSYVEKVQSLPAKELSPLALPLPYVFHDDLGNDFNKCENRFRSKSQIQLLQTFSWSFLNKLHARQFGLPWVPEVRIVVTIAMDRRSTC
jgi:hypothetical protein